MWPLAYRPSHDDVSISFSCFFSALEYVGWSMAFYVLISLCYWRVSMILRFFFFFLVVMATVAMTRVDQVR